jgi:hypothetical protein
MLCCQGCACSIPSEGLIQKISGLNASVSADWKAEKVGLKTGFFYLIGVTISFLLLLGVVCLASEYLGLICPGKVELDAERS